MSDFEKLVSNLKKIRFEMIILDNKIKRCKFLSSPILSEKVRGGKLTDLEEKYAEYNELIKQYKAKQEELRGIERQFRILTDQLEKVDDRIIIELYYLCEMDLKKISEKMNFSYGYVRQRKSIAVKQLLTYFIKIPNNN